MIRNFIYFIVFTTAPGVLPEQNDWYRIQPWKVNEIKAYKKVNEIKAYKKVNEIKAYKNDINRIKLKKKQVDSTEPDPQND